MRKVLVVTEGQTELIFVRNLLRNTFDNSKLSFECIQLRGATENNFPYKYPNPNAEFHFQILDVGNDERLMTIIKEREQYYFDKGFEKIIGIRDMYSAHYRERSHTICDEVNGQFTDAANRVVQELKNCDSIVICFAIMEIEAWVISMYSLLEKVNPVLTVEYIDSKLGFNLRDIDPQHRFFHPSDELKNILKLVGQNYRKSQHDTEKLTSRVDLDDVEAGIRGGKCTSFKGFLDEISLCYTMS
jgi:hypothetical protein